MVEVRSEEIHVSSARSGRLDAHREHSRVDTLCTVLGDTVILLCSRLFMSAAYATPVMHLWSRSFSATRPSRPSKIRFGSMRAAEALVVPRSGLTARFPAQ
jgi:hypothetical protein